MNAHNGHLSIKWATIFKNVIFPLIHSIYIFTEPLLIYQRRSARHTNFLSSGVLWCTAEATKDFELPLGALGRNRAEQSSDMLSEDQSSGLDCCHCQKCSPPPLNTHRPQTHRLGGAVVKSETAYLNRSHAPLMYLTWLLKTTITAMI